jgi:hypothetical protein
VHRGGPLLHRRIVRVRHAQLMDLPQQVHHPNAMRQLRGTVVIPFVCTSKPFIERRRRDASFP